MGKKCIKIYNAWAQPLHCLLRVKLLFGEVSVAIALVIFLNSLLSEACMLTYSSQRLVKLYSPIRFLKQLT